MLVGIVLLFTVISVIVTGFTTYLPISTILPLYSAYKTLLSISFISFWDAGTAVNPVVLVAPVAP